MEVDVSDHKGVGKFDSDHGTGTGRVSTNTSLAIRLVILNDLVSQGDIKPSSLIKMDVEGDEVQALPGARKILETHKPVIMLSTRGDDVHSECKAFLSEVGYEIVDEQARSFIAR